MSQGRLALFLVVVVVIALAITILLIKYACCQRLTPRELLADYPARFSVQDCEGVDVVRLNEALVGLVHTQVAKGCRLGTQIAAFYKGRQIVNVYGGAGQFLVDGATQWLPVQSDSLFMSYSVVKGVAAALLAYVMHRAQVTYDTKVCDVWPRFQQGSKATVTIGEAVSHRAGLKSTPPLTSIAQALWSGNDTLWKLGTTWIEDYAPDWPVGSRGEYHPVSFSWIIGGIVERLHERRHIADVMGEVAKLIGHEHDMYIGQLPEQVRPRVCRWSLTPMETLFEHQRLPSAPPSSIFGTAIQAILCLIESLLMTSIANSVPWSRVCLPSSNGYFTATSVARLYASLSRDSLFPRDLFDTIVSTVSSPHNDVPSDEEGKCARLGLGWHIFAAPRLHGPNWRSVLGHQGLGGCTAFLDTTEDLSICIMTNSYIPYTLNSDTESNDAVEIAETIRNHILDAL